MVTTNGGMEFFVHYDYTQRNQLAHITQNDYSPLYSYTYDAAGNMTRRHGEIIGDSTNAPSAYYDELNRPTYWEQTRGGDVGFSGSHYQYDNVGREVAVWRDEDGNKGERYWFNAADHLTRAVYKADNVWTASPSNWNRFRDYTYTPDLLNWTSVNDNGYVAPLTHNDLNQYTGINGFVPSYDGNFNQTTTIYGPSFVYNAQNQVVGGSMQCTYDGLGRCVKRTIGNNTIVFAYDGWKPVAEYDGGGNLHARNIYGPGPDELLVRGDSIYGWFFYHADKQGSVTALVAGDGTVVEKYSYDAFGRPTVTDWWDNSHYDASGNLASWYGNRFMFTGREWLSALQLYDYRHRLYNPDNGRFLQTDPMGLQTEGAKLTPEQKALYGAGAPEAFTTSEMNLFRYCGDDPVDRSDALGLSPGDSYPTMDAAGIQAIRDINETSIALGREYSGLLYRMRDGSFSYTAPIPGTSDTSPIGQRVPAKTTFAGLYHTHGKYDAEHDYHNFIFSTRDRKNADDWNCPSYLGNPAREVRKYTPNLIPQGGKSEAIATSYPLPPPPPSQDRTFQDLFAPFKKFWK